MPPPGYPWEVHNAPEELYQTELMKRSVLQLLSGNVSIVGRLAPLECKASLEIRIHICVFVFSVIHRHFLSFFLSFLS